MVSSFFGSRIIAGPVTLEDWALARLRHSAQPKSPVPPALACEVDPRISGLLVKAMSNADPRARQEQGLEAINGYPFGRFVCQYRDAMEKLLETGSDRPGMPDVDMAAREASVQLAQQAILACGRCPESNLLKTVAAASAVKARMYPEALRLLFELMETRKDLRDVYESVQKACAAQQRGKGEVSLGAPR